MIGLVLGLVLSCGKKEPVQSSKVKVGAPIWEFETGGIVESSPAIGSDGTVYVGSWDKKLYAINGKSGVKLWEFETGQLVGSSPAIGSEGHGVRRVRGQKALCHQWQGWGQAMGI